MLTVQLKSEAGLRDVTSTHNIFGKASDQLPVVLNPRCKRAGAIFGIGMRARDTVPHNSCSFERPASRNELSCPRFISHEHLRCDY